MQEREEGGVDYPPTPAPTSYFLSFSAELTYIDCSIIQRLVIIIKVLPNPLLASTIFPPRVDKLLKI